MAHPPEPALKKLDLTIARLRLLLADVAARERTAHANLRAYQEQREKLLTFAIYGDASLDTVLGMLADVNDRLADTQRTQALLAAVRERAEGELESLQLTKGIEEARATLDELQARRAQSGAAAGELLAEGVQAEIERLQALINEASERAARSIEQRRRPG